MPKFISASIVTNKGLQFLHQNGLPVTGWQAALLVEGSIFNFYSEWGDLIEASWTGYVRQNVSMFVSPAFPNLNEFTQAGFTTSFSKGAGVGAVEVAGAALLRPGTPPLVVSGWVTDPPIGWSATQNTFFLRFDFRMSNSLPI